MISQFYLCVYIMSMYKSFLLYFINYVIIIIDYILSFVKRKIIINTLFISITIYNILFILIKVNNRNVLKSGLKMSFSSNEMYFCTSGDTKKWSLPVDKAYKSISLWEIAYNCKTTSSIIRYINIKCDGCIHEKTQLPEWTTPNNRPIV